MRNITISVDEEVAEWARVHAARNNSSVSKLVGRMLREYMERDSEYEAAMRYWLAREPTALRQPGERLPTREELYSERTDWPRGDRGK